MPSSFNLHHASFRWLPGAIAGLLLTLPTVLILRPGTLLGTSYPLATIGVFAGDVVLACFAAIGSVHALRKRQWAVLGAMGALIIAAAVNLMVSEDPLASVAGWIRLILLVGAIAGIRDVPAAAGPMRAGFLVGLALHTALGFWQFFTFTSPGISVLGLAARDAGTLGTAVVEAVQGRWLRAYGGFAHPNVFGTALLIGCVALMPFAVDRTRTRNARALAYAAWAVAIVAAILTFSRSAWLGLALIAIVLAIRSDRQFLAGTTAVLLVAAFAVLWPLVGPRFSAGENRLEQISVAQRLTAVDDARVLIAERPYLGMGLHAMPQAIALREPGRDPYTIEPVHDVPVLALAEVGAFGVIIVVLAIVAALYTTPSFAAPQLWIALLPTLIFDHHLWSLPIGPALLLALFAVTRAESRIAVVEQKNRLGVDDANDS